MTKKSRTILIASVLLTAGAAIAVPVIIHRSGRPNFAKMNPRQIRQYFDSNEFRDANQDARREIRGQMFEAMQARREKQVNDYFALPEGEQRVAYLDNLIDQMQARRAEFMAGRDPNRPFDPNRFGRFGPRDANDPNRRPGFGQQGANGRQRPRMNPERMRERSGRQNADNRVKSMQFQRDMQNRMKQRGIQAPMGRGGFGGPGGFGPGGGRFGPPN